MNNIKTLNTIRHKINEFELKCKLLIAVYNKKHLSACREFNEQEYSCIYFNKRQSFVSYNILSSNDYNKSNQWRLDTTSIEDLLLTQKDDLYNPPLMSDKNIININTNILNIVNKIPKRFKLKAFNIDTAYTINVDDLYVLIRLVPTLSTSLNPMIMSINCPNVYIICNGHHNHLNSIAFICKLNNRFDYRYRDIYYAFNTPDEDVVTKCLGIKYPFINKSYINSKIFDNFEMAKSFQYQIEVDMLYMPTLKLADKHGIKVLNNF